MSSNNPLGIPSKKDSCGNVISQEPSTQPGSTDTGYIRSINGKQGENVTLNTDEVPEGDGNLYFTEDRARQSLDAEAPILFDKGTGIISHDVTGMAAGTFGDTDKAVQITVDAKGHVTAVVEKSIPVGNVGADGQAIEALTGTGYLVRTGANTWALREITGEDGQIVVEKSKAVDGNTLLKLADMTDLVPGTYGTGTKTLEIQVDQQGRIVAITEVDIDFPDPGGSGFPSLGEITNVDPAVDTPLFIGSNLRWNGTQWVASYAPLAGLFVPGNGWTLAKDAITSTNINHLLAITEVDGGLKTVHYNLALYKDMGGVFDGANRIIYNHAIGQFPAKFRPNKPVVLKASVLLEGSFYKDDLDVTMTGFQNLTNVEIRVMPDGTAFMSGTLDPTFYSFCSQDDNPTVLIVLVASFNATS